MWHGAYATESVDVGDIHTRSFQKYVNILIEKSLTGFLAKAGSSFYIAFLAFSLAVSFALESLAVVFFFIYVVTCAYLFVF